ncbi:serine/threonine protein kinase [Georgenia sp. TF02-10]|uniref:serine/threonine-protein kinase n=1 Tax=Georgenia sp. TF02-10 TaxID=2917725 RepID=UPI001FA70FDB|nr:serine/threonine-protein kinase [Georgenia sp. TF02-10]UNX54993.1 serine/threonine protein kinase [Georgenia sp. TF02-10]
MIPAPGLLLGGRYELTERIAVGGMGEVWQARDHRLGRTVAAKVLRAELAGDEHFLARLRAEARNTAGLRHPNLAMLLDHGEQDGSGYLVQELVRGETLADRLERERTLAPTVLLPLLVQACRGLHAAHAGGVVHRDVKPANLILTPDGGLKITDFGVSLGANQAPMTSAGMVMGTAQYLPPEQAMGRPATAAGDVYALGVVAYECLVGSRPFTGATQVDIAFAHVNTPLPALPATVPGPVREVVERMLAKDPAQRPASALACAQVLEGVLAGLGTGGAAAAAGATSAAGRGAAVAGAAAAGAAGARPRGAGGLDAPATREVAAARPAPRPGASAPAASAAAPAAPPVITAPSAPSVIAAPAATAPTPTAAPAPAPPSATRRTARPAPPPPPPPPAPEPPAGLPPSYPPRRRRGRGTHRAHAAPDGPATGAATSVRRARTAAEDARSQWARPTWAELAADQVWLRAMVVVLAVLALLLLAVLATLGGADGAPTAAPAALLPLTTKDL